MAKLSAHGTELFRMQKLMPTDDAGLTESSTFTYAFMSDGAIMKKVSVVFRANGITPRQPHSYGWTLAVKQERKLLHYRGMEYQKVVESRLTEKGFRRIS
jgi:hypothetical protein